MGKAIGSWDLGTQHPLVTVSIFLTQLKGKRQLVRSVFWT